MRLGILASFFMGAAVLKSQVAKGSRWVTSARTHLTSCTPRQLSKGQDTGERGEVHSGPGVTALGDATVMVPSQSSHSAAVLSYKFEGLDKN